MTTTPPGLDAEAIDPAAADDYDYDYETFLARLESWEADYPCRDDADRDLLATIVRLAITSDRDFRHELAHLHDRARRARIAWDADRRAEAEALAAKLSRAPARTAAALRGTRHGALVMIDRWEALAAAMFENGKWSPAQHRLALDLLGTPREFRDVRSPLDPPNAGPSETAAFRIAFARRQAAALRDAIESGLDELDDSDREFALLGLPDLKCPLWNGIMSQVRRNDQRRRWAWSRFFQGRNEPVPAEPPPAAPAPPKPSQPATPQPAPPKPPPRPAPAPIPLPPAPARTAPADPEPPARTAPADPEPPAPDRFENRKARRARRAAERRRSG